MCCSETGNLLLVCRVEGALAKWRRHYGEPKGLSGKSSLFLESYKANIGAHFEILFTYVAYGVQKLWR